MALVLSCKQSSRKMTKKTLQGTNVAAISVVALVAGILAIGVCLTTELVSVDIIAATRGSITVVGGKMLHKAQGRYEL